MNPKAAPGASSSTLNVSMSNIVEGARRRAGECDAVQIESPKHALISLIPTGCQGRLSSILLLHPLSLVKKISLLRLQDWMMRPLCRNQVSLFCPLPASHNQCTRQ